MRRISHQWAGGKVHGLDIGNVHIAEGEYSACRMPNNLFLARSVAKLLIKNQR